MTSIADIREAVSCISDSEVRSVCVRIVDRVAERLTKPGEVNWTIKTFSNWVGRQPSDHFLQRGIELLTSQEDARLLDMHFYFFNPEDLDDIGEPVDDDEVISAYLTGFLVDPVTGKGIYNFEETLVPYFTPNINLRLD